MEFFMHTKKAIARGCPNDRVFVVVSEKDGCKTAWKCNLYKDGIIHPSNPRQIINWSDTDILSKLNPVTDNPACVPTAEFVPDSFYFRLDFNEVKDLALYHKTF